MSTRVIDETILRIFFPKTFEVTAAMSSHTIGVTSQTVSASPLSYACSMASTINFYDKDITNNQGPSLLFKTSAPA